MNTWRVVILAALIASPAVAEEGASRLVVPQPRTRLDPNSHTAIPAPKTGEKKEASEPAITMSPMIVRSTMLPAEDPQQERQPEGPFSLLEGGWILRKDMKGARLEVGAWPYFNILWKTDRFKSDLKHVGTEFVRLTW